jgi:hypothetical protein
MRTRHRLDRHARLPQPGEVSFDRAKADSEVASESGTRHRLPGRSEECDELLLPLYPSKGEVVVA